MRTSPEDSRCPSCRQRAPIVLRGIDAFCTACGAPRKAFGAKSLTLAGKPLSIGGAVASAAGWAVLVGGLSLAVFFGVLLHSVWPGTLIGWAFGVPTSVISLLLGLVLIQGGRRWRKKGAFAEQSAKLEAVRALAAHRGGSVTSEDVAGALLVSEAEADLLLTELAKDAKLHVNLDVDDEGRIHYLFGLPEKRWRVLEEAAARGELGSDVTQRELDSESGANRVRR